jgi:hypothetical protein
VVVCPPLDSSAMRDLLDELAEAGRIALEASAELNNMADRLLNEDSAEVLNVVALIQEAAYEIRRQGLSLRGEAELRRPP